MNTSYEISIQRGEAQLINRGWSQPVTRSLIILIGSGGLPGWVWINASKEESRSRANLFGSNKFFFIKSTLYYSLLICLLLQYES